MKTRFEVTRTWMNVLAKSREAAIRKTRRIQCTDISVQQLQELESGGTKGR